MLDAYTIRKIAPRLLLAVIGINISYYLVVAVVDLSNIVAVGVADMLRGAFLENPNFGDAPGLTATNVAAGGIVTAGVLTAMVTGSFALIGASLALGFAGLMLMLIIFIFFLSIAVLLTLIIRYGLIILLAVTAPIAIAATVLPGTEKYFQQWWSLFLKTLAVYPIIAILFAMSDILTVIFLQASNDSANSGAAKLVFVIVAIMAMYAPLFLIPFAFQLAGGAMGTIFSGIKGLTDRGNQFGQGKLAEWKKDPNSWYAGKQDKLSQERWARGITPRQIAGGALAGGRSMMRGQGFRDAYGGRSRAIGTPKLLAAAKKQQEKEIMAAILGDDDVGEALYAGGSAQEIDNALMKANSKRFGDINNQGAHTADQIRERQEARALVEQVQGGTGDSVRRFVAGHEIASSTTGFNKAGGAELFEKAQGVGDSEFLRMRSMIDMKGEAKKNARLDSGGFSTSKALNIRKDYSAGTGAFAGITDEKQKQQVLQDLLLDSAIEKATPSAIATMDANGMKAISTRLAHRLSQAHKIQNPEQRAKAIQMETAHLAALRDALNYASAENREDIVEDVYSMPVPGDKVQVVKRDGAGNKVMENGKEVMEMRSPTVRELIQKMDSGGFSTYDDAHRGYGASDLDSRNRMDEQLRPPEEQ